MSTPITEAVEARGIERAVWRIDPARSSVEFAVPSAWGLSNVRGRFDRYEGTLDLRRDPAIELDDRRRQHRHEQREARQAPALGRLLRRGGPSAGPLPLGDRHARRRAADGHRRAARRGRVRAAVPRRHAAARRPRARDRGDGRGGPAAARDDVQRDGHDPHAHQARRARAPRAGKSTSPSRAGPPRRPRPGCGPRACADARDVVAGGLLAHEQRLGDLPVRAACCDQREHLELARGQLVVGLRRRRRRMRGSVREGDPGAAGQALESRASGAAPRRRAVAWASCRTGSASRLRRSPSSASAWRQRA